MGEPTLAIFAALADEIRIVRSKMQIDESITVRPAKVVRGEYDHHPLILVRTGIGGEAMAKAVRYCCEQYRPDVCVNVGYCGGAAPDSSVGEIVIADRVVDEPSGDEFATSPDVVDQAKLACEDRGLRFSIGGLATVVEAAMAPHDKAYIGTKCASLGIDMESYDFMKACGAFSVRAGVVRAVLDPMDMRLPDFKEAVDEEGNTSIWGAIKHMIRRPKDAVAVPRIEYCAVQAREAIAGFIDAWLGIALEER
jgi:nucleoside phosphorylase